MLFLYAYTYISQKLIEKYTILACVRHARRYVNFVGFRCLVKIEFRKINDKFKLGFFFVFFFYDARSFPTSQTKTHNRFLQNPSLRTFSRFFRRYIPMLMTGASLPDTNTNLNNAQTILQ